MTLMSKQQARISKQHRMLTLQLKARTLLLREMLETSVHFKDI